MAVDPGQALRNDGLSPPEAPGFLGRLQQAEAAAGAAAGLAGSASALAQTRWRLPRSSAGPARWSPCWNVQDSGPKRWSGLRPRTSSSS